MGDAYHTPVMVDEVIRYLRPEGEGTYVDGTLGGGGHAELLLEKILPHGRLVAFDADPEAIEFSTKRLDRFAERITFVRDNFANMGKRLDELGIHKVNGVLLDLGVSSHQLDETERGFSFQRESRLDMRMNGTQQRDAWSIVNSYEEDRLADILWLYGEERYSRRIARTMVASREQGPITTTRDLATIIEATVGQQFVQKTLARIFQAIRIVVNDELENLRSGLQSATARLAPQGRIVVIAYHSLEDRIVKDFFREESRTMIKSEHKLIPDLPKVPRLTLLTKKPVEATEEETSRNPRARSAKLRAAERVGA